VFAARAAIASAGVALVALTVVHLLNISTRVNC
jgi:hypothetical protein